MKNKITITLFFLAIITTTAHASDFPKNGILYGTKEKNSMVYSCNIDSKNLLNCNFTKTHIRKKMTEKEAIKEIAKIKTEATPENIKNLTEDSLCSPKNMVAMSKMMSTFDSDTPLDVKGRPLNKTKAELNDIYHMFSSLKNLCQKKTTDAYINFSKNSLEKDLRTCVVISQSWSQVFTQVRGTLNDKSPWIVKTEPYGSCGVVQLDRFEKDNVKSGASFWNFTSRKAILNPNAMHELGFSCSKLDEETYPSIWQSKPHYMQCDYIEFGIM